MIQMPWLPFEWDVNDDGQLTISDVGLWLQHAFFLPGDWVIWTSLQYWPQAAQFFELTTRAYGSTLSALISVIVWLIVIVIVMVTSHYLAAADRALTKAVLSIFGKLLLNIRIARYRLLGAIRRWQGHASGRHAGSAAVELNSEELRVLKAHTHVSPPATLALSDLVRATGVPRDQITQILDRLEELELLNPMKNDKANAKGYALTKPGRDLLTINSLTLGRL